MRAKPAAKPDPPTNDTSPTASSGLCGETNKPDTNKSQTPLDKEAFYGQYDFLTPQPPEPGTLRPLAVTNPQT